MKRSLSYHLTQILMLLVAALLLAGCWGLAVFVFPTVIHGLEEGKHAIPWVTKASLEGLGVVHHWWWALTALLMLAAVGGHLMTPVEKRPDRRGLGLAGLALLFTLASAFATAGCIGGLLRLASIV